MKLLHGSNCSDTSDPCSNKDLLATWKMAKYASTKNTFLAVSFAEAEAFFFFVTTDQALGTSFHGYLVKW
jgi:hypothetical protein